MLYYCQLQERDTSQSKPNLLHRLAKVLREQMEKFPHRLVHQKHTYVESTQQRFADINIIQCKDRRILLIDLFPLAWTPKRCNCSGSSRLSQLGLAIWGSCAAPRAVPAISLACARAWGLWQRSCHQGPTNMSLAKSSSPRHPNTWSHPVTNLTNLLWERSISIIY